MSASPDLKDEVGELVRVLTWEDAFWVAAGVPPLVLFSLGGVAGVAGNTAFIVWIVSISMGFSQSFTYAEMAGMFANKSGGASVYGAMAWLRYSKFVAPLSVWCNWFAWSPVLSLGCSIAAGYILNLLAPIQEGQETPAIRAWTALTINVPGLGALNFNMTFVIGLFLMVIMLAIQHFGILLTAKVQKFLAVIVLLPLLVAGLLPIATGALHLEHFENIVPPSARNSGVAGSWTKEGWTLILGAMYMGAWTTYAFETAVCYTSEFKDPKKDTFRAIFFSGILCCTFFFIIPFSFQGFLGHDGMLSPEIADGTGVAKVLGNMAGKNPWITQIFVILMILGLFLSIMTALAGSSRTLYQGSKDGWLPSYLSKVNDNGAPVGAMLTDFMFNVFLLALASDADGYYFVMAVSNVGYMIFNFLNLNAGWIHRIDSGHLPRAWKAPTTLIAFNTLLSYANALFLGAGAKVWGYSNALQVGFAWAALIIPVFCIRHYLQDGGKLPAHATADLCLQDGEMGERKAGRLPYLALVAGLAVVLWANWFFLMPA
jgi:amino acid transporter